MFWNTNNTSQQFRFIKPFNERYRVEQTSEIIMSSLVIKTVTELRWDVRLLKIQDDSYHIELLSLDNILKETNNPNMRELTSFNNAFKRMYSELNMIIDHQGELIQINNISEIQRKWAQVKAEMEAIQTKHDNMRDIIALNDDLFNSVENITAAVRGNEFFEVFLNAMMGINLPGNKTLKKKSLFAQEFITWRYEISAAKSLPGNKGTNELTIKGSHIHDFDRKWLKNAYGSFPIYEIADKKPIVTDDASYTIDETSGRLLQGLIIKEEIVHQELLRAKMVYQIIADHPYPNLEDEMRPVSEQQFKQPAQPTNSFIVD